jgi:hypothetical protein
MDDQEYAALRYQQLADGQFAFWVWRSTEPFYCPDRHIALDGIALPPDHLFWQRWRLPIHSDCRCYIVGARTEAGVRRVGGDPGKPLPDWWSSVDPSEGMHSR